MQAVAPANEAERTKDSDVKSSAETAAAPVLGWYQLPNNASWQELPDVPPAGYKGPKLFLEIFAGLAGLSNECALAHLAVLPPIDTATSKHVRVAVDISDPIIFEKVLRWIRAGLVAHIHFGTPCGTFSMARKDDTMAARPP